MYKDNIWSTEWAAIFQKVATQQPKPIRKVKRHQLWHQVQVTENNNKTTALERSVMKYWGGGGGLNSFYGPNLTLSFWSGTKHLVGCSVRMITP